MEIFHYANNLQNYMKSDDFGQLSDEDRQRGIEYFRKSYLAQEKGANVDDVNTITEEANIEYLRGSGRGRANPERFLTENNIAFPGRKSDYRHLSRTEKQNRIDVFQERIPDIAKLNPTQRQDTEYYLNQHMAKLQYEQDLPVHIATGGALLTILLVFIWLWGFFSAKPIADASNKKKNLNVRASVFFLVFAVGLSIIFFFLDRPFLITIPWVVALGGISFVYKFAIYCQQCGRMAWGGSVYSACEAIRITK